MGCGTGRWRAYQYRTKKENDDNYDDNDNHKDYECSGLHQNLSLLAVIRKVGKFSIWRSITINIAISIL